MPWEHCGHELVDDAAACPDCGVTKASWTVQIEVTRTFKVSKRQGSGGARFLVVHADGGEPLPGIGWRVVAGERTVEGALDEFGTGRVPTAAGEYELRLDGLTRADLVSAEPAIEPGPGADGDPLTLRLRAGPRHELRVRPTLELVFKRRGAPRASVAWRARLGQAEQRGTLDAEGRLRLVPPPGVAEVEVWVGEGAEEEHHIFEVGALRPHDDLQGAQQRLKNLGFHSGAACGTATGATTRAIGRFQRAHGLEATGAIDEPTRRKLVEMHGG